MQILCRNYAEIMQKLCRNYAEIMQKLCNIYAYYAHNKHTLYYRHNKHKFSIYAWRPGLVPGTNPGFNCVIDIICIINIIMIIIQGTFIICIIMQALHNMHNNARVCIIGIIIGIRNYAEIMQKLCRIMQKLCRNYVNIMQNCKLYRNYANYVNIM